MNRLLLALPLLLLACSLSAPLSAKQTTNTPKHVLLVPVSVTHKRIDPHPDGKATVIWFEPVTKDTTK